MPISDTLFFFISKVIWTVIAPDTLLVLLLVFCLLLFWLRADKKALILLHAVTFVILIITFLPVGKWVFYPLEKQFPRVHRLPDKIDGILMLGGPEMTTLTKYRQQVQLNHRAERYTAFLSLIKKHPDARHVFAGGSGNIGQRGFKAADVARMLLAEQGVDTQKIIFESESRNTYENALLTQQMVHPKPGENWILITTASHMPRSVGVFHQLNWQVIPFPVDYRTHHKLLFEININFAGNLRELKSGMYAWIGLAAYFFTQKTPCLLPSAKWIENHPE